LAGFNGVIFNFDGTIKFRRFGDLSWWFHNQNQSIHCQAAEQIKTHILQISASCDCAIFARI